MTTSSELAATAVAKAIRCVHEDELVSSERYTVHVGEEKLEFADVEVAVTTAASAFAAKGIVSINGRLQTATRDITVDASVQMTTFGEHDGEQLRVVVCRKKR